MPFKSLYSLLKAGPYFLTLLFIIITFNEPLARSQEWIEKNGFFYSFQKRVQSKESLMGKRANNVRDGVIWMYVTGDKLYFLDEDTPLGLDLNAAEIWLNSEVQEGYAFIGPTQTKVKRKVVKFVPKRFQIILQDSGMESMSEMQKNFDEKFFKISPEQRELSGKYSIWQKTMGSYKCRVWQYSQGRTASFISVTGKGASGEACLSASGEFERFEEILSKIPSKVFSILPLFKIDNRLFEIVRLTGEFPVHLKETADFVYGFGSQNVKREIRLLDVQEMNFESAAAAIPNEFQLGFREFFEENKARDMPPVAGVTSTNLGSPNELNDAGLDVKSERQIAFKDAHNNIISEEVYEKMMMEVARWRQLVKGMSMDDVAIVLGPPERKSKANELAWSYDVWHYPNGSVYFSKKKLAKWDNPTPPKKIVT